MSFQIVSNFEKNLAEFWGSKFAIATDSCTHAVELSLRLTDSEFSYVLCPKNTYISIPFTLHKLNLNWGWCDHTWENYYKLSNTRVIDAAAYWQQNGYVPNSLMCLSFQYKKPLKLGRGGAILTDNDSEYELLSKMVYDGRNRTQPWAEQRINTIGYHYYMTPETAAEGIEKLPSVVSNKTWSYRDYPYLPDFPVFKR